MQPNAGSPQGRQGRGYLLADDAGLTHSADHHPPPAFIHRLYRLDEIIIYLGGEAGYRLSFYFKNLFSPAKNHFNAFSMFLTCLSRALSSFKETMFGPSQRALSGSGCTSRNNPSQPKATAARDRPGTKRRSPPEQLPPPPGS